MSFTMTTKWAIYGPHTNQLLKRIFTHNLGNSSIHQYSKIGHGDTELSILTNFTGCLSGGPNWDNGSHVNGPNYSKFGPVCTRHKSIICAFDILLYFRHCCVLNQGTLKATWSQKLRSKFSLFDPTKIRGGMSKMSESIFCARPGTQSPNHQYTFDGASLGRLGD